MKPKILFAWPLIACIVCLFGCSEQKVKTVDVSGTVTLDGKPLEGVSVVFIGPKHVGTGVTGADGKYRLENGAQPGTNKVYFSKKEGLSDLGEQEEGVDAGQMEAMAEAEAGESAKEMPKELIPAKYADPDNPAITFEVPEGGTSTADFKLTSGQ